MQKQTWNFALADKQLVVEHNDLAVQANGSITMEMDGTVVTATAVMGGMNQYADGGLALRVDYLERNYARGAILGSKFNKREGRPTDEATLTARVIDRTIRPYFPKGFDHEVQVVVTVLALGECDPDVLAVNAASLALHISDIPWEGPVACVRISQNQGSNMMINPTYTQRKQDNNYYNAVLSGSVDHIGMIEFEASEVSNEDVLSVSQAAMQYCGQLVEHFTVVRQAVGTKKLDWSAQEFSLQLVEWFGPFAERITSDISQVMDKQVVSGIVAEFAQLVREQDPNNTEKIELFVNQQIKQLVRQAALVGQRIDGRNNDQVRELYAQAGGVLGAQHGTGIFYRGETRVMSVLTLGSLDSDVLTHHEMEIDGTQRWMHHYNFPSYSVGETGRMGSPGRREIGHGTLAQKSIVRMLPSEEEFPYAIRVVSEVMSSNGSTSMASTCAATMALLDGGVPLKKHVAGIAVGMVQQDDQRVLLTDIVGKEDYYGDMDFKVAGTRDGITAIQLDCKIHGLDIDTIARSVDQAEQARMKVLDTMESALPQAQDLTDMVERIVTMELPQDKIGLVIGKGGVTIKQITADSGAKIDIKRSGVAYISGNGDAPQKAIEMIKKIIL